MKSKLKFIATIILSLVFSSCNDFLDVDPDVRAQLTTPESVSKLLTNAYPQGANYMFYEISSDNVEDNYLWIIGGEVRPATQNYWWQNVDNENQDSPTFYWTACYEAIAHANQAIQYIEEKPNQQLFSAQYGEALMCRAYAHFMLAVTFCKPYNALTAENDLGVVYMTDPETTVFEKRERVSLAKTYELIEKDLLKGLKLIKDGSYKVPKYHFNRAAANAFASRFYLFKGDWDNVIEYASEALGANPSDFLRDWVKYKTLETQAFQMAYANYEEPAIFMQQETLSSWYRYYCRVRYVHTGKLKSVVYGSNVAGGNYLAQPQHVLTSSSKDLIFLPKFYERFKTESVNATIGRPYLMVPLITAEETLLNRAEAYTMLGDAKAYADLNSYYSKRIKDYGTSHIINRTKLNAYAQSLPNNLTPSGYAIEEGDMMNLVKVVVDSRRKEFIHEGNRWYDIKRFNIEITHKSHDASMVDVLKKDDPRREFQIPQQAIASGIIANPR